MKYLVLSILFLAGCSSTPKKIAYQDRFWIGCMNGLLHYTLKGPGPNDYGVRQPNDPAPFKYEMDYANAWCRDTYEKIKDK